MSYTDARLAIFSISLLADIINRVLSLGVFPLPCRCQNMCFGAFCQAKDPEAVLIAAIESCKKPLKEPFIETKSVSGAPLK